VVVGKMASFLSTGRIDQGGKEKEKLELIPEMNKGEKKMY